MASVNLLIDVCVCVCVFVTIQKEVDPPDAPLSLTGESGIRDVFSVLLQFRQGFCLCCCRQTFSSPFIDVLLPRRSSRFSPGGGAPARDYSERDCKLGVLPSPILEK